VANNYGISSGLTACPAAGSFKVACQFATSANAEATVAQLDISFDSVATGAGAVAVIVALVRCTGASSGGASYTPGKVSNPDGPASEFTARINDTTDGASPTVLWETLVYPTGLPLIVQYPLGREWKSKVSDFIELRIKPQTGFTACNYDANLQVEAA
jgi:hypothetical protein